LRFVVKSRSILIISSKTIAKGHLQMFKRTKSSNNRGFTIVEVMFVLAIAGMIMLIVFLAVPALQRNSRNTQRKSDASRVAAALTDFVSNSNGALPNLGGNWATDCDTVVKDAGKLGAYNGTLGCSTTVDGSAVNTGQLAAGVGALSAPSAVRDAFLLDEKAVCSTSGSTHGGQSRQMALLYTVEGGSGYQWSCIQAN
jgi:prepilin-type N-terminal cleavage/methylation domain-containing protein